MLNYIFEVSQKDNSKFKISVYNEQLRYDIIRRITKFFIDHIKKLKSKYKLDLYKFLKIKIIPYVQTWCWLQYKNSSIQDEVIPYLSDSNYNFDEYIEDVNYSLKTNIPNYEFNDLIEKIKYYLIDAYKDFSKLNDKIKNLKIDKEIRDNGDIVLRCDFNGENRSIKIVKEIYDRLKSKFIMTNIGDISYIDEYIYCLYFRYAYIDADMQQLAIHPKIKIMMKKFGVNFELFGAGINVLSDRYCSLFYDIEKYFGSQGDFISFRVKQGIYWCNPPYINSLMEKCSRKLLDWLENNHNVGFLLTIPVWDKYTQKNIKDKDKVQKNQNINVSQDEFKDYPCYYLIQPYIKYELIIPKYAIPYFSFKYNEYKYAVDTYMLFIYNKLDDKYSKPIIEVFDHIYENYKKELVITY